MCIIEASRGMTGWQGLQWLQWCLIAWLMDGAVGGSRWWSMLLGRSGVSIIEVSDGSTGWPWLQWLQCCLLGCLVLPVHQDRQEIMLEGGGAFMTGPYRKRVTQGGAVCVSLRRRLGAQGGRGCSGILAIITSAKLIYPDTLRVLRLHIAKKPHPKEST